MLIGLAGFAGAGKTTAIEHLKTLHDSEVVYLGQAVLDELNLRKLARSAENEKLVRNAIRAIDGPAALALRREADVRRIVQTRRIVLVDAIYHIDEFEAIKGYVGGARAVLLAIHATAQTRASRLAVRTTRPLSAKELETRDSYEREKLQTDRVFREAYSIENEGTLKLFHADLSRFFESLSAVSPP